MRGVFFLVVTLVASLSMCAAFSEVSSPKDQLKNGVAPDEIICRPDLVLMIRADGSMPACVRQSSVDRLIKIGWALEQVPSTTNLEESTATRVECGAIEDADSKTQERIVENNLDCIPKFFEMLQAEPQRHLPAFYGLVSSPTATDRLFSFLYNETYYHRFKVDEKTIDEMIANIPDAAQKCHDSFRCQDWQKFIVPQLSYVYSLEANANCAKLTDPVEMIRALRKADYYCTESIAQALVPAANEDMIHKLLSMMNSDSDNERRNASRILIRFAEQQENQTAHVLVTQVMSSDVKNAILETLKNESSSYVIPELTVLIDAHFRPFFDTQPYLESVSKDSKFDSVARWRAMNAVRNIISEKETLAPSDAGFVLGSLKSDELWVRSEAAFICEILRDEQTAASQKTQMITALHNAYDSEDKMIPKSFIAKALDRYEKTSLYSKMESGFEKDRLYNSASRGLMTIKSSLPQDKLEKYLDMLEKQKQSFFEIMGSRFNTPVRDDPNDAFTLIILATPAEYFDYMNSFVGYGANAGGLYLENKGTLYTYQRNQTQSTYTVEDLIRHEFTHYLEGRYVYYGIWSDPDYHAEPKGWADEGLAEFFSQSVKEPNIILSQKYVDELCGKDPIGLDSLLGRHEGYDKYGQWDYANSWSFTYYMMTEQKKAALNIYSSFRDGSYRLDSFGAIGGVPMDSLESGWHHTMESWCKN